MTQQTLFFIGALVAALFLLPKAAQAQCDKETELQGKLITNTVKNPQMQLDKGQAAPEKGDKGELLKYFENTIFGRMTGWMNIGLVEVTSVQNGVVTFNVLEEKSSMTVNGEKKNHYEKGNIVKFSYKGSDKPQAYETKHPNGKIKEKGTLVCGKRQGAFTEYLENGTIAGETTYEKGELNGPYKLYHEDGKLREQGNYVKNKVEGEVKIFYPDGKTVHKIVMAKNGILHGAFKEYYETGILKSEFTFANGKQTSYKLYYANGKPEEEGEKDGDDIFKNNIQYREDGTKEESFDYYDRKQDLHKGNLSRYDASGSPSVSLVYDDKGNVRSKTTYAKGQLERKIVYGANNTATVTEYQSNGQPAVEYAARMEGDNPVREGKCSRYYPNGDLAAVEYYKNNVLDGTYTSFHPGNKAHITAAYAGGKMEGAYAELYPNGKPKAQGTYSQGNKTGIWWDYDEKGKKKKSVYP